MQQCNKATLVLLHGVIFTANAKNTVCEAIAVRENAILYVGTSDEAARYIDAETTVIDLQGKMVLPGLIDSHIHPPGLSLSQLYEVQLLGKHSIPGYVEAVREFYRIHPEVKAIYGRGWSWSDLQGEEAICGPRKEYLDAVTTDIPVILRSSDGHTLWVNSKALEMNGITAATVSPPGGEIIRHSGTGELWGTLKESAMRLLPLAEYSPCQYEDAMKLFQREMHSYGITAILSFSSMVVDTLFQALKKMEEGGTLQMHVCGALAFQPTEELKQQLERFDCLHHLYQSPLLKIRTAKFFADGVVEGGTSCLCEPYSSVLGKGSSYRGEFLWDMDKLKTAFSAVTEKGIQIHVHSTGDQATANVLDALQYVKDNGRPNDCRHTITHLQLVRDQDLERFRDLQVIASVQPYWHCKGPRWWQDVDFRLLGDRANHEFPLGSFFRHDVVVASSSDYIATLVPNPFVAMQIGVTRNLYNGSEYGVDNITDMDDPQYLLNKQERATIIQMIRSFTINNAYALFIEDETGSLETGKRADFIVIDQNVLTIDPLAIGQTKVLMTFFGGRLVYSQ